MDLIDLYILSRDALDALRVVNIEALSGEADRETVLQSMARLMEIASQLQQAGNSQSFVASAGVSGQKRLQVNVTLEVRDLSSRSE